MGLGESNREENAKANTLKQIALSKSHPLKSDNCNGHSVYTESAGITSMALEKELKTFDENVDKWADQNGKFVLIHGEEVVDFFAAYEDAIKAGYQKFGLEPFLVKQISAAATVQYITRSALPHSSVHA